MSLSSTRHIVTQLCLLTMCFLLFNSCKDEKQIHLTQQNIATLARQNEFAKNRIVEFRGAVDELMKKELTDRSFERKIGSFYNYTDILLNEIAKMRERGSRAGIENLFANYTDFLNSYKQLEKSAFFNFTNSSTDVDSFLYLDEKKFNSKYTNNSDSLMIQNQLLILESDVLLNQNNLIEKVYDILHSEGPRFDEKVAIAITEKCGYKKGERLKVTALLVKFCQNFEGHAVIDGQKIEPNDGIFEYSRIITESPGFYKIPVTISIRDYDQQNKTYPAITTFEVK